MGYTEAGVRFQEIEQQIGITFENHDLLGQAFIHDSYSNEHDQRVPSNERLEFLGDAVIGLVAAEYYYCHSPGSEAELTEKRKARVNNRRKRKQRGRRSLTNS
jgi:ribonuclease-3